MEREITEVYCGNGKGKTTLAVGRGLRFATQGKSVIIIQFLKGNERRELDFLEELDELELTGLSCLPFGMLRENCFALIKGKHTPSYFRFIFQLSPKNLKNTLEVSKSGLTTQDLNGVFLNIKFQDGILSCTNGVSYRSFTLDHTFDQEWDLLIRKFFAGHDIPYTDIN